MQSKGTRKNKKHSVLWQLRWYLLLIAEAALVFSVLKIAQYKRETDASSTINEELAREAVVVVSEEPAALEEAQTEEVTIPDGSEAVAISGRDDGFPIEVDFDTLLEKNPDCVAWLYSEDTPINFAVLQADDNTYYLYRVFDGTYNGYGTIFLDCNCAPGFSNSNSVIFGHDMRNGTMFGSLRNYSDQEYYEQHKTLWLATPTANYRLTAVAGYVHDDSSSLYVTPISRSMTDTLVPVAITESVFDSGCKYNPDARYVTLSTCSSSYSEGRFALICEMTKVSG